MRWHAKSRRDTSKNSTTERAKARAKARARFRGSPEVLEARDLLAQLLPDVFPWADQARGYIYGSTIDRSTIPGRTLLRLTTAIPNLGSGPMELRGGAINPDGTQSVFQRVYDDVGGFSDRLAGTFTYHPEHGHIHFDDYAVYNLRSVAPGGGVGPIVAEGDKVSFCLIDVDRYNTSLPGAPSNPQYVSCGQIQGISVGWADVYDRNLPDQWIDVTGVPNGQYWLEVVVDPSNRLLESNEANNTTRIPITLNVQGPGNAGPDVGDTLATALSTGLSSGSGTFRQTEQIGNGSFGTRDVDLYRITATAGSTMTISTALPPGGPSMDTILRLFNAAGTQLALNDDFGGTLYSQITYTFPTAGTGRE